jgi:hypothetical protein
MLVPAAAQIREICTRPSRANDTGLQTPSRRSEGQRPQTAYRDGIGGPHGLRVDHGGGGFGVPPGAGPDQLTHDIVQPG